MLISFNTEGINIYFLCPFVCFFCLVISSYIAGQSCFGQYSFLQNILISISEMLAIIPHLISVKIDKNIYENNSEKNILSKENNSSSITKKSSKIDLIYNNSEEILSSLTTDQILILGFIDFIQSLSIFYGNELCGNQYQLYFWSSHIFFLCLFTKFLLLNRLYKHQIFSFIIFIFFDALHMIVVFLDDIINYDYRQIFFLILSSVCFSLELAYEKKLMNISFISIYKLCFLLGLSTFFYNLILSLIMTIIQNYIEEKSKYLFDFIEYFNEMSNHSIILEIILIIFFLLLSGVNNIFQFLTIKNLTPNHALITHILLGFYSSLINFLFAKAKFFTNIISIIFSTACVITLLIFLEVIELNFWGINRDTKHNIGFRSDLEGYFRNTSEGTFNENEGQNNNNGNNNNDEYESDKEDSF